MRETRSRETLGKSWSLFAFATESGGLKRLVDDSEERRQIALPLDCDWALVGLQNPNPRSLRLTHRA
jgi:hypothetical protein